MGLYVKLSLILSLLVIKNVVYSSNPRIDPLVRIKQGLVRGQLSDDGKYSYFLGIPYATVNEDNAFGDAEPPPGFGSKVFNAYDGSIACPQKSHNSSTAKQTLDCLRLNIHVPSKASSKNPLPVLVWIHGGKFDIGQGSIYDPKYLMEHGIVVVTINYRLGPYGFMCLDTPSVPGNQGLKDQFEAFRWIRYNIAAFGGNPYKVTIAGYHAGSSCTLLHLFSSKEKLFTRVIVENGTPLSNGMFVEADTQAAVKIAQHLDLKANDTEKALEFLKDTSFHDVIKAVDELSLTLGPCKENSFSGVENFVETYPDHMTYEKKVKNTAILIGHAAREGKEIIRTYGDSYFESNPFYDRINEVFDLTEAQLKDAASIVRQFYIADKAISRDVLDELANFELDFLLSHPTQRMITKLVKEKANPIYAYNFNYLSNMNNTKRSYMVEVPFIFNIPQSGISTNNAEDGLIIGRMTTMWANFVKFGNPTPTAVSNLLPVIWEPVSEETRPHMVIDKQMHMGHRVYNDRMAFWDLFFDKYGKNQRLTRECTISGKAYLSILDY